MIAYLIKSTLCFAVLFGFYKLVLENKALHHFKRYYLLASLIFSLIIPLITFTYTTTQTPEEAWISDFSRAWESSTITTSPTITAPEKTNYLPYLLWSLYGIGLLIFGSRFALNLIRLIRKIKSAETLNKSYFTLALLSQSIIPHSFLKYIFLSKKPFQNREIPSEVIAHEATHVRQKHSLDILFIELVQVLFWFNPLFWIAKNSIKLNHEFLADQGVIQEQNDLYQYQNILLDYASSTHHTTLESSFSYSSTKKRILMLSQTFSRKRLAISALLLIPIITGCILVFNQGIISEVTSNELAIEGHWIDQEQERNTIVISNESGLLSLKRGNSNNTTPIIKESGNYFIENTEQEKKEIKIDPTDNTLTIGEKKYLSPTNSLKMQFSGLWENKEKGTSFMIQNNDGIFSWVIIEENQEEEKMYWPNLTDTGFEFAQGDEWSSFTIKQGAIVDHKGNIYQKRKTPEHLSIKIIGDDSYTINDRPANNASLMNVLKSFNTNRTKQERQQVINATISEPKLDETDQVNMLHKILQDYGVKDISIYMGLFTSKNPLNSYTKPKHPTYEQLVKWQNTALYTILIDQKSIKNKEILEYHPDDLMYYDEEPLKGSNKIQVTLWTNPYWQDKIRMHDNLQNMFNNAEQQVSQNYAKEFLKGAQRNGKKAIVIEIKNNSIRINGNPSNIVNLYNDINILTKDWSTSDYSDMAPSFLFKNSDKQFIEKADKAFQKTNLFKQRQDLQLKPTSPEEFERTYELSSTEDHLEKMKNSGSQFFFNNVQISYKEALRLTQKNKGLSIQTPYPYTNPPQTFIASIPIDISETTATKNEASQRYKVGDTVVFTIVDSQQQHKAVIKNYTSQTKQPTAALLAKWSNDNKYGIWIDGKLINNASLKTYRSKDFAMYYESKLEKNAKNYGKYKIRVDLHTMTYAKKISAIRLTDQEELKKSHPQITPALIQEYIQWATKINKEQSSIIKSEKLRKMQFVFNELMSPSQRKDVPPFPQVPPPPPVYINSPEPPSPEEAPQPFKAASPPVFKKQKKQQDEIDTIELEDSESGVIYTIQIDSAAIKKQKSKTEKNKVKAKSQKKEQKKQKRTPLVGVKGTSENIKVDHQTNTQEEQRYKEIYEKYKDHHPAFKTIKESESAKAINENVQKTTNQQEMIEYLKDANSKGAILTHVNAKPSEFAFYDTHLSLDFAIKLIKDDSKMRLYPFNSPHSGLVILISNNIENTIPKLSSENRMEHIRSLYVIGAKFYVNKNEVEFKKAQRFLKKNRNTKITSTITPPVVHMSSSI